LAEAQSISKESRRQEGVSLVKIEIIEELMYVHDWLAKEVRSRALAQLQQVYAILKSSEKKRLRGVEPYIGL
jgi:hypothetical protein